MKTMPVSASAGWNVSDAGAPEWTPIPVTVARAPSVVCFPAFITPLPQRTGERTDRRGPLLTTQLAEVHFSGVDRSTPIPTRSPSPRAFVKTLTQAGLRPIHGFSPTVTMADGR